MDQRWIITFDISADPGRRAVHRVLGHHGIRTLYTVYDLVADTTTISALTEWLRHHVDHHDHLLALPVCAQCRTAEHGGTIDALPTHAWITA